MTDKIIEKNLSFLKEFEDLSKKSPGPIPYSIQLGPKLSEKKVFICAATHGNEVGSIPGVIHIIKEILNGDYQLNCQVIFALGNIEAFKINQRYLEEDMNRAYGREAPLTVDARRASKVGEMIEWADLFCDLHQTIEPTMGSFYVIRKDPKSIYLCDALNLSPYAIVIDDAQAETKDRITGTAFALMKNTPAFTIELSQKGYSKEAEDLAISTIKKVLDFTNQKGLENLNEKKGNLKLLEVSYSHKFTNPKTRLVEGLKNLKFYKKGDLLGYDGDKEILCPFEGYLFFPKYPKRDEKNEVIETLPTNLFMLAKEIQ